MERVYTRSAHYSNTIPLQKEASLNSLLQAHQQKLDYVSWLHQQAKVLIDPVGATLTTFGASGPVTVGLYTPAAFRELSRLWVQVGWSLGYYYDFT